MENALLVIALAYAAFMIFLVLCFLFSKSFKYKSTKELTPISVVIPMRNEALNIERNLKSLIAQNFPKDKFEILLIDDSSEDDTRLIVKKFIKEHAAFSIKLIELMPSSLPSKKTAIEQGISTAAYPLILQTDADTVSPQNRLMAISSYYTETKCKFIIGSVLYKNANSFFAKFQELELISLQAITAGAALCNQAFLCNGANIAYERQAYLQLKDSIRNQQLSSGDDVFLLESFKKHFPTQIRYIKSLDALCYTYTESSLKSFLMQRLRWSSKSAKLKSPLVLLSALVLLSTIAIPFFLFFVSAKIVLLCICIKAAADYIIIYVFTSYFHRNYLMYLFTPAFVLYYVYIYTLLLLSLVVKQKWKNRPLTT